MKLLYIHNHNADTSIVTLIQVFSMCNAFSESGIQVVLLLPRSTKKPIDKFIDGKYGKIIKFHLMEFESFSKPKRIGKYLDAVVLMTKYIKKVNPDICFIRDSKLLNACLKNGIDTILELHNSKLHTRNSIINYLLKMNLLKNSKHHRLKMILCISESLMKYWLTEGIEKDKVFSYHDGFDKEAFIDNIDSNHAKNKVTTQVK